MPYTIGLAAHADAGKTTLSEQILFLTGAIRSAGRVDQGNTRLDTHPIERKRGISVFTGTAAFRYKELDLILVDTPGHADFYGETERASSVMDMAILVISAAEGIQSQTITLWELFREKGIPVVIFINKTDRDGADIPGVFRDIRSTLSGDAVMIDCPDFYEELASRDEDILDSYLSGTLTDDAAQISLGRLTSRRGFFPILTGSALKGIGITDLLNILPTVLRYLPTPRDPTPFSALCWRVRRDAFGTRYAIFHVTSGTASAREVIAIPGGSDKLGEIRSGSDLKFEPARTVSTGEIFMTNGLSSVSVGDTIGEGAAHGKMPDASTLLNCTVEPVNSDKEKLWKALCVLSEEEPILSPAWTDRSKPISLLFTGPLQLEILTGILRDRFGLSVTYGEAAVSYRETLREPSVGIGHYEPLRHYAEVWLRLIPTGPGSGVRFVSRVSTDEVALNWQRLIETHVLEKAHPGVLIGAPLTDVTVELIAAKDHLKHTEGGDFREAVYRAIRCALLSGKCAVLEPLCRFTLRFPESCYGRVMKDMHDMSADTDPDVTRRENGMVCLGGTARFAIFSRWQASLASLTGGRSLCRVESAGYIPVRADDEFVSSINYDIYSDQSPDSVFCSHGAGHIVPWNEVRLHAHLSPVIPE